MSDAQVNNLAKWATAHNGTLLLTLRDEIDLKFICQVLADTFTVKVDDGVPTNWHIRVQRPPDTLVYVQALPNSLAKAFWTLLWQCFGLDQLSDSAAPREVRTLSDDSKLTFLNMDSGDSNAKRVELIETNRGDGLILVNDANLVDEPLPHLALRFFVDAATRSTARKPYLCHLIMTNFPGRSFGLLTTLSPKWWKMHGAYAALRAARGK